PFRQAGRRQFRRVQGLPAGRGSEFVGAWRARAGAREAGGVGLMARGPGRPPYKPTDADRLFVSRAVKAGSRINDIADCLYIMDDTLRKHFRYEIATAREALKASAIGVLEDCLTDGSLDAAKFVLARVAGWTERQEVEHA